MPQDLAVGVKMVSRFDNRFYAIQLLNGETRYIPSVTTLLSAISKDWIARLRGDIGNREADLRLSDAADRGSRIHHACYVYATGGVVMYEYPPEENHPDAVELRARNQMVVQQCDAQGIKWYKLYRQNEMEQFGRFVKWVEIVKPTFVLAEQVFWSLELGMAGTLDYVVDITQGEYNVNGSKPLFIAAGRYVLDLKSGSTFDDSYYLQMAAYKKLYEERRNAVLHGTIGLHVNSSTQRGIRGVSTYVTTGLEVEEHFQRMREAQALWNWQNPNVTPKIEEFISIAARENVEVTLVYGGIEPPRAEDVVATPPVEQPEELQLTPPAGEKHGRKKRDSTKTPNADSQV